ncbi:STAS domain-containing protein [Streptomyces sp. NRRL B-24085]|uniref:STAS domain-containing protein n=1 Tax=Streptomyces sp. NRRL B-24085 TaxID=1709476 RepID=UPI0006B3A823|nr:STAS domain-containing protein [Streptomyces sp. NRRL B-24085]
MKTRAVWRQALRDLIERRTDVLRVDLARVRFVEVTGVTGLAVTVQRLPEGQRIVRHRSPAQMLRILELFRPVPAPMQVAT